MSADEAGARARHATSKRRDRALLQVVTAAPDGPPVPRAVAEAIAADRQGATPELVPRGTGWAHVTYRQVKGKGKDQEPTWERVETQLSNFRLRVAEDLLLDDGQSEPQHRVRVTVLGPGNRTATVTVPAERLARPEMLAVEALGAGSGATLYRAPLVEGHVLTATLTDSAGAPRTVVYTHTGWRRLPDGRWAWLHADGALGASGPVEGVRVELPAPLQAYRAPAPPKGRSRDRAVGASLGLLQCAPERISAVLLAATWRAVVPVGTPDVVVWEYGPTGAGKTVLAALTAAHFGQGLDERNLPAGWSSTANAIEGLAAAAAHVVLPVDDWVPHGGRRMQEGLALTAERIVRGAANAAGRLRADRTGGLVPARVPRTLLLATGEDLPPGQSLRARTMAVRVGKHDTAWAAVSRTQQDARAGLLAEATAGFVAWLAAEMDRDAAALATWWAQQVERWRTDLQGTGGHARIPAQAASLLAAVELHALYTSRLRLPVSTLDYDRVRAGIIAAAEAMADVVTQQRPHEAFLRLLSQALTAGRCHLLDLESGGPPADAEHWGWRSDGQDRRPQGDALGWLDRRRRLVHLLPDVALAAASGVALRAGEQFPTSTNRLLSEMKDAGLSRQCDPGRNTGRIAVGGQRPRVLTLDAAILAAGTAEVEQ